MADVAQNLRSLLAASTGVSAIVGARIHQGYVPEGQATPRIWLGRSGQETPLTLDSAIDVRKTQFDVECHDTDLDVAQQLSDAVRDALHGYRGDFGDAEAQGIFVDDVSDDYLVKGIGVDEGIELAALTVTVWHE